MKCLHCGFVGFGDLRTCKMCGRPLAPSRSQESLPDSFPEKTTSLDLEVDAGRQILASSRGVGGAPDLHPGVEGNALNASSTTAGMSEGVEGVVGFGRRRERAAGRAAASESMAFDFEPDLTSASSRSSSSGGQFTPSSRPVDVSLARQRGPMERGGLDLVSLHGADRARVASAAQDEPLLTSLRRKGQPPPSVEPVIALTTGDADAESDEIIPAPLAKRFWAGLVDVGILAGCVAIFAASLRLVGGHIQFTPATLTVFGFIAAFWLFVYFAAFGAFAFSTPGQAALGLAVRNFDGGFPDGQDSLLRAFGYLVSTAAFMVGFLWALMDSDTLAWHDHISGTLLVERGWAPVLH
jgi:uncharacterized RDD family membrane protein YckC